jgi:hypothetical protein
MGFTIVERGLTTEGDEERLLGSCLIPHHTDSNTQWRQRLSEKLKDTMIELLWARHVIEVSAKLKHT